MSKRQKLTNISWYKKFGAKFSKLIRQFSNRMLLPADKIGDYPIKYDMKLGPQTQFSAKSQSAGTIQLVPNRENGNNYSTALTRNMGKSAHGNLVQWVNL